MLGTMEQIRWIEEKITRDNIIYTSHLAADGRWAASEAQRRHLLRLSDAYCSEMERGIVELNLS